MTSLAESRGPGAALDLAAGVDELAAAVAEHRSEFDSNGRLPDDLFEQLASAGVVPAPSAGIARWARAVCTRVHGRRRGWPSARRHDRLARRQRRRHGSGGRLPAGGERYGRSSTIPRRSWSRRRARSGRAVRVPGRLCRHRSMAVRKRFAARHVVLSDVRGRGRRAGDRRADLRICTAASDVRLHDNWQVSGSRVPPGASTSSSWTCSYPTA